MKKPLQVKVLEWWFGLLAGVASLLPLLLVYGALRDGKVDLEMLPPVVWLCVGILFFWGLFVAVRRGQWASAELPYWSLILFFLAPLPYKWRSLPESMGLIIFLFVMLALAGVPSVCFHLRSSRLWFKERRGNRGPGYVGGCLTAGFILLLAAGAFLPAFHSGRHAVLVNKGQEVSRLLRENELAKSYGGVWVDPNACSNSVEFLRKVQKAIRGEETGLPSFPEWTVVVNPPEGVDGFPLLFTANVDVTVFPEVWDGNAGGDARLVLRPGILVDSDKIALVVRSSGSAQILHGKYARRKSLFGSSPWKLTQQTYFLTPRGKVR